MGVTASINDLCLLSDAKIYLGVSDVGQDAIIQRLITAQSDWMNQVLSRNLTSQSYVNEIYDGNGNGVIIARNYPVTAVLGITVNNNPSGQAGDAFRGDVPNFQFNGGNNVGTGIKAYTANQIAFAGRQIYLLDQSIQFFRGKRNVMVSYTAGFAVIPASLQQACLELVALRYKEKDRVGISTQTLAGQTISYARTAAPDSVMRIMAQFENVVTN